MAELTTTKLNAESHLLLEQPLLRLPYELSRRNFKSLQRSFEREQNHVLSALSSTANVALSGQPASQTLLSLDNMISRLQGFKRKMQTLQEEEKVLQGNSRKRIQHLKDLYEISSLTDVKFDEWSRIRLNRLLVDYLLRSGYAESARALAREKGIEALVDLDVFVQCHRIEESLRNGSTAEGLAWCQEHKPMMKKTSVNWIPQCFIRISADPLYEQNNLEFQLRLQQYIELRRDGKLLAARQHAQRYIAPHTDSHFAEIHTAAALLAFPPNTAAEPYKSMYSSSRWSDLANLFIKTHHELFSLPPQPLLHIALSAGLSALKTPSCHSAYASSSSNASSSTTTVCPICSTELNELARGLPYAHHTKSYVENDPVVLPNGRIYGRERLMQMSAKIGLENGEVKDPTTGEIFEGTKVRKVYIS
ncbi:GID complex subunit containing RING finger motif [Xylographa pallens]|nr:GID complex subunit containing RING finger motif [Xylographa pallens]